MNRAPMDLPPSSTARGSMARRRFLQTSAIALASGLLNACAPAPSPRSLKMPLVAFFGTGLAGDAANVRVVDEFRAGLRDEGIVEGRDVQIRWSWAEGRGHSWAQEQMPGLIKDHVQVIVAAGSLWRTVREMTDSIPIVMVGGNALNVVELGWASSVATPGGNITGLSFVAQQAYHKRLENLMRVAPRTRRLVLMSNASSLPMSEAELRSGAQQLGLEVLQLDVRAEKDVERAFDQAKVWGADALSGEGLTPTSLLSAPVTKAALRYQWPSVYPNAAYVEAGGLMYYGAVFADGYQGRRVAWYVARILRGAAPGSLPIEVASWIRFVVNRKTLTALGLTLPSDLFTQVTTWVE